MPLVKAETPWIKLISTVLAFVLLFFGLQLAIFFYQLFFFDWDPFVLREPLPAVPLLDRGAGDNFMKTVQVAHRIPAILHQTYKDNVSIPQRWLDTRKTCLQLYGDRYQIILWTDQMARDFIAQHYPAYLANFDSYPYTIQKADALRYFILHHYGGVYMDLDVGCRRDFDELRQFAAVFPKTDPWGVSNDMMMSSPKHPFLQQIIDNLHRWNRWMGTKYPTVMLSTGPGYVDHQLIEFYKKRWDRLSMIRFNGSVAAAYSDAVAILPGNLYGNNARSYFFHVHGSSWHDKDEKVFSWIYSNLWSIVFGVLLTCFGIGFFIRLWNRIRQNRPKLTRLAD